MSVNFVNTHCRSYGVLVWEVATYGKTPNKHLKGIDIVELASNGSLKLTR